MAASVVLQTLTQISNPRLSSTFRMNPPPSISKPPPHRSLIPRAAAGDDDPTPTPEPDSAFENRIAQVRLKYRSGTGKKAEQRRAKKSPSSSSKRKATLPPVPLREAESAAGVKVELGFSPYSERINGRLAALGLAALVLVELASGKGVLNYHSPPIIFLQIYAVTAAAAVFVKYEKERISIWPSQQQ